MQMQANRCSSHVVFRTPDDVELPRFISSFHNDRNRDTKLQCYGIGSGLVVGQNGSPDKLAVSRGLRCACFANNLADSRSSVASTRWELSEWMAIFTRE